ncbi:MAG TPA: xanthine dehydrogenase family protein subunit M [Marmoricola sp.]|nr:xanthine dehydrogenase family protein subunit M [Marmoricola sp.]
MKPAPFELARPASLPEALEALAANPGAKVLAGGQSLIPLLSMRLAAPGMLVDINAIPELAYVRTDDDGVRVGALARHAEVEADPDARRVQPLLSKALRMVAHPTIRNRGTTVGSVVHADAAAEMPAVLALLGGDVTAASTAGRRTVPAADLFVGPMESSLRHDEIATEAFFPALRPGQGVACEELSRRHGDYALCGVAALVDLSAGTTKAGYFSVCDVPTVVDLTPALGEVGTEPLDEAALSDAAELALGSLEPADDIHATADYRAQLARTLTRRVVAAAHADALTRSTS